MAHLERLTEEQRQKRHEQQDHVPFRKGCPVCIGAQARQRSHWRASVKSVYSASFDIAGPFKAGRSFDATASGRDKGRGYKYFLACAFTVPLRAANTVQEEPSGEVPLLKSDPVLPDMAELFPADGEDEVQLEPVAEATGKVVRFRARSKRPEEPEEVPVSDSEGDPPLPPPAEAPPTQGDPSVRTRMLCRGTPLRSRKGREVCGAIQAMINRLEAFGFPVHRCHADRAQELKSKQLLIWLRDRGIHTTWTPGDTPAGNRAEVAVQHLKSQSRKLLHAAQLPVEFWPLALLHASTRHWCALAEQLGIVQPALLPFGLRLHARKRQKTGFGSHWSTRTEPGKYLGQAPNTPGGHLVLVEQASGENKVLLTNTVYPVRDTACKPRFRVKGKSSPEFLLRAVSAWHFPTLALVQPTPRGECEWAYAWEQEEGLGISSSSSSSCWFFKAEEGKNHAPVGQQTLEEDGAPIGLQIPKKNGAPEGLQVLGRNSAPIWQQVPARDNALEGLQVLHQVQVGQIAESVFPWDVGVHGLEKDCLRRRGVDLRNCWEVLKVVFGLGKRGGRDLEAQQGKRTWGYSALQRRNHDYPEHERVLLKYLNRVVASWDEKFRWAALDVYRNECLGDSFAIQSEGSGFWVVALGEFSGGGLWVEDVSGNGPVVMRDAAGGIKTGDVRSIHGVPTRLGSGQGYALMPWVGDELCVLKAWVPTGAQEMSEADSFELRELGFELPCLLGEASTEVAEPVGTQDARLSQRKVVGGQSPPVVGDTEFSPVDLGDNAVEVLEQWEVEFPCQLVGALALSEAAAHACKASVQHLCQAKAESELEVGLGGMRQALLERAWIEQALTRLQNTNEGVPVLRSLAAEVPLMEVPPTAPEQFLQTRTVSLEEARKEMGMWHEAGKEEVEALEVTTGAVERIDVSLVDRWISEGKRVVQVPGKAVLTRKSGVGKRRLRAVCCGNHMPSPSTASEKMDLYAGGVDALTVRVVLGYSAQFDDWTVCVLDIKTAFLNAPARSSSEGDESGPIIVVKPPYFLIQLGLLEVGERWRVRRALYGLQTSPRDWAVYRDKEMREMVVHTSEPSTLAQSQTDDSMWFVKSKTGSMLGVVIVYVDDIAIFGPRDLTQKVAEAFMSKWKTSTPTWPTATEPVSFCGIEVARFAGGWRITQSKYLREILRRYEIEGVATCPMSRWDEPELEDASVEQVREAQAITGAVLWAVTRTRPDLMFVAARMSQYSTKTPAAVKLWGVQALKYVASTMTLGLEYKRDPGPMLGEFQQLSLPRSSDTLELYSDASHAPAGGKSMQTTIAAWRGSLVAWEATRQPFVTLSSAEAELVSMVHSVQMSDSIVPVIEELIQTDMRIALMADNAAALASFAPSSGSWRNRHLRLRAASARERVELGTLTAAYVPGDLQVADVGTKPLSGHRMLGLLKLVGVRVLEDEVSSLVAKSVGRMGHIGTKTTMNLPSAAALAVAVLACLPEAAGQPSESFQERTRLFQWVSSLLGTVVLIGLLGLRRVTGYDGGVDGQTEVEVLQSPRLREEQPSGSSGPRHPEQSEPRPIPEAPDHDSLGTGPSLFPMVGRVDPRADWIPVHFLRRLFSMVGEHVVACLGLDAVEIWWCRALGRTFRYGIAFAFERARGRGPLQDISGRTPVYDIAQARTGENLPEPEDPVEDDPTIDQVRHIPEGHEPRIYFHRPVPGNSDFGESTDVKFRK